MNVELFIKSKAKTMRLKCKMLKLKVFTLVLLLGLGISGQISAQQRSIEGTVTDNQGSPLPGVTVVVKGTTQGTATNADGEYSFTDIPEDATLVFSFVGMRTQEVEVGNQTTINVTMEEDAIGIEEVVAIGYGTIKKADLTGGVSSVGGDIIENRKATQISQALQGTMPGVMVTRSNNAPGATSTIRIRGITTIGENDPLVIVDGVPVGSINDVNPNDVESISVLKDAASASIYGSRAAAGVILVTTKRAKTGVLELQYNVEYGFEKPTEMSDYVGAKRYMEMTNELRWNDNENDPDSEFPVYEPDIIKNYDSLHEENPDIYPNTDWVDLILKDNAPRQSHFVNISAGSNTIRTKASLAYDEVGGLYIGKNYKRLTARLNNDITINKYLSSTIDFFIKRSIYDDPSTNPMSMMRKFPPIYSAVWSNGLISEGKAGQNVYAQLKYGGYDDRWYNQVGGKASLTFTPLSGLDLSFIISPLLNNNKGKQVRNRVEYTDYDDPNTYAGVIAGATTNSLKETRYDGYKITTQFLINYLKSFGSHNLNAMAGYESFQSFNENLTSSSSNLEFTSFPYLDLANTNYLNVGGDAYETAYKSYFGRIMYDYKSKYLIQSNIRYDGSSRFHRNYRWGTFPSIPVGWVISEESFVQNREPLFFLKLRGSWGRLGNERIGNYPYQSSIKFDKALFYKDNSVVSSQTAAQKDYALKNISWETTESFNIGFDANFFNNSLQLAGDYYIKTTFDMLLELEIPDFIGFNNPEQNTGKMETKGWEFELRWQEKIGE
ncbi:MAG: SusC/RagA family TonB-linked outer membrane protein, partial [bacterium]